MKRLIRANSESTISERGSELVRQLDDYTEGCMSELDTRLKIKKRG